MLQIIVPVRAQKRLIYLAFVSCFFCIVVLHLSISYRPPLNGNGGGSGGGGGGVVPGAYYNPANSHAFLVGSYDSPEGQFVQRQQQQQQQPQPSSSVAQSSSASVVDDTSADAAVASSVASSALPASAPSPASIASGRELLQKLNDDPLPAVAAVASPTAPDLVNAVEQSSPSLVMNKLPPFAPSSAEPIALGSVAETKVLSDSHSPSSPSSSPSSPLSSLSSPSSVLSSSIVEPHPAEAEISHYFNLQPHIDNSASQSEAEQLNEIETHDDSHLALNYWQKAKKYPKPKVQKSGACRVEFPSPYELEYNNIYWQHFSASNNSNFYLYNAYYDDRWRGGPLPNVRILAMIDRIAPPPALCQIWFERISVPIISQATYVYGWYNKWGNYADGRLQPYIVTCPIPHIKGLPKNYYPTSVSLVESRCQKATNNLKIVNDRPEKKKEFAVCVKGLDFLHEDLSVRLVEWIELLRLLGAQKIFLYELEVHPNISKVLDYYQRDGIVELTKITLPGAQPNLPGFRHLYLKNKLTNKRQNELIPYNDCLYRNLYTFDYVALLDIDEIIMPLAHQNWSELMREVQRLSFAEKNYTRASYNVRNVYFLDDLTKTDHEAQEEGIPQYLHMLQHVTRSKNYTKPGQYVKCFHNTERAVALHNHFPLQCLGTCTTYSVPVELAHLQHYRKDCVGPLKKSCKEFRQHTVRDTTIFKYKEALIPKTTQVLSDLGFFDS